jgi:hypothetical protein
MAMRRSPWTGQQMGRSIKWGASVKHSSSHIQRFTMIANQYNAHDPSAPPQGTGYDCDCDTT